MTRIANGPENGVADWEWSWWVGSSEEAYHTECGSREEAIRIAREDYGGAHICEARKDRLDLGEFFDANDFLERADDAADDDHGGEGADPLFDVAPDKEAALQQAVRATIRKWQADHGLTFVPWRFTEVRNEEFVPAPIGPELSHGQA